MASKQLQRAIDENDLFISEATAGVVIIQVGAGVLGYGNNLEEALESAGMRESELDSIYPSNANIDTKTVAAFYAATALISALETSSDWGEVKFYTSRGRATLPA